MRITASVPLDPSAWWAAVYRAKYGVDAPAASPVERRQLASLSDLSSEQVLYAMELWLNSSGTPSITSFCLGIADEPFTWIEPDHNLAEAQVAILSAEYGFPLSIRQTAMIPHLQQACWVLKDLRDAFDENARARVPEAEVRLQELMAEFRRFAA